MVWAEDPETGERALKRVVRTFLNEKDELVHVQVNGETITCTTEHPFYVQGKGWVAAKDLNLNDKLEIQNGEDAFVDAIRREKLDQSIQVFNFEVEDFHTYYVGVNCVLVHNSCAHNSKEWRDMRRKYWQGQAQNPQRSKWYDAFDEKNLERMRRGRAPIGYDNRRVQLHHCREIDVDINDFVEIGAKAHTAFHRRYGYRNFIDIRTVWKV